MSAEEVFVPADPVEAQGIDHKSLHTIIAYQQIRSLAKYKVIYLIG